MNKNDINEQFFTLLKEIIAVHFPIISIKQSNNVTVIICPAIQLRNLCFLLKDHEKLQFNMLLDVSGVDYLEYAKSEWLTHNAANTGFDRAIVPDNTTKKQNNIHSHKHRFASIYQLLSTVFNVRLMIKVFLPENNIVVDSVCDIWSSANWYEREAYDLFGIFYQNHPDLRRILTDYGFQGHPFRKDFPITGQVEIRYDTKKEKIVYESVSIIPRTLVPKVIR